MRLFHVLPILSLLFGARASSLDSRRPDAHPLDARDDSDVCATLDPGTDDSSLLYDVILMSGYYESCLCASDVSQFLLEHSLFTDNNIDSTTLTDFIVEHAPACNYPVNGVPACVDDNPCGFTCPDGYTASPLDNPPDCVCAAPNVICNGNCVVGPCPSSQAITPQKRWVGSGSCREKGHGWAACGVFGGGARAWECVNTAHDLESCGGCVLPLTPFSPIGQDCTALPGVADISCLSGECVIHRCMPGYALSSDGISCISTLAHTSPHVAVPEDDDEQEDEYMEAIRYGLVHRPF